MLIVRLKNIYHNRIKYVILDNFYHLLIIQMPNIIYIYTYIYIYIHIYTYICGIIYSYMEVSQNRRTPSHHSFIFFMGVSMK